jgi:hypothetical protein
MLSCHWKCSDRLKNALRQRIKHVFCYADLLFISNNELYAMLIQIGFSTYQVDKKSAEMCARLATAKQSLDKQKESLTLAEDIIKKAGL